MHFEEGKGRNQIAQILSEQQIKVSQGSVGNIIRSYRTEHDRANSDIRQSSQSGQDINQLQPQQLQSAHPQEEAHLQSQSLVDWDSEQNWQRRFFKTVMDEKRCREDQIRLMRRQRQELDEQQKQINQQRENVETREKKLLSVEELIPSAKQLKDIGIDFVEALIWIDCIKEVSQKERVDERTAA